MSAFIEKSNSVNNNEVETSCCFNEFEYETLVKKSNYWNSFYEVNDIDADMIFSKQVFKFLKIKKENKIKAYLIPNLSDNERSLILKSFIDTMCQRELKRYFLKLSGAYNKKKKRVLILNESELSDDFLNNECITDKNSIDEIIIKDIKEKLDFMYETLSEKEQSLYDVLSSINEKTKKNYTKDEACALLGFTNEEYMLYIDKLKVIFKGLLGTNINKLKEVIVPSK